MKTLAEAVKRPLEGLRTSESPIEVLLFNAMMRNRRFVLMKDGGKPEGEGVFLFPQFQIGPYRADFYIVANGYPPGMKIWPPRGAVRTVIECDGAAFHTDAEQIEYDRQRDLYMQKQGIGVQRFTGSAIYRHPDYCVDCVLDFIDQRFRG